MQAVFSAVVGEQVCDLQTLVLVGQQHAIVQLIDRRRQRMREQNRVQFLDGGALRIAHNNRSNTGLKKFPIRWGCPKGQLRCPNAALC
jgi:hypothetical protein